MTSRIELFIGIAALLIQRDPITTAKEAASIDLVSGGRFDELGFGRVSLLPTLPADESLRLLDDYAELVGLGRIQIGPVAGMTPGGIPPKRRYLINPPGPSGARRRRP